MLRRSMGETHQDLDCLLTVSVCIGVYIMYVCVFSSRIWIIHVYSRMTKKDSRAVFEYDFPSVPI